MAVDVIARGIAGAAQVGLAQANEKIDRLEGKTTRILYAAKTNPTATEIGDFVNVQITEFDEEFYDLIGKEVK